MVQPVLQLPRAAAPGHPSPRRCPHRHQLALAHEVTPPPHYLAVLVCQGRDAAGPGGDKQLAGVEGGQWSDVTVACWVQVLAWQNYLRRLRGQETIIRSAGTVYVSTVLQCAV